MNYFEILGVNKDATSKEIRSAYKGLVRQFHPDKADEEQQREEFENKLGLINEAYSTLEDNDKRIQYIKLLEEHGGEKIDEVALATTITHSAFDIRNSSVYEDIFGFKYGQELDEIYQDEIMVIDISFRESLLGAMRGIKGAERDIELNIFKGISDGAVIMLMGEGRVYNNIKSDLIIGVHVKGSSSFERNGLDLVLKQPVPVEDGKIKFSMLYKKKYEYVVSDHELLEGNILRIKGEGVDHAILGQRGDLYVPLKF